MLQVPHVQYLDVTGVAMVPYHNRHTRVMEPDEASCGIVSTFLVAEQIKSKMTRECDPRQVNSVHKGFEGTANLLVK